MASNKNNTGSCTYFGPNHSETLLKELSALREQGQLLDLVLSVGEERFQVHRIVLAACSDFFRIMFIIRMKESNQDTIELKGLSANGLKHIIDFAYSSQVTLDLDCIHDVLEAAVFLQMAPVVKLCEEFLKSNMSVETCLNIGQMARTFGLASLKESADALIFHHFRQIAEEQDFLHIPMERLVFFLQSNELQNCSEIDLFCAAIQWLQHDESRRADACEVLRHVRFPLIHSSELVDIVQTVDIMVEDVACRQYLLEAFNYQILPFRQHAMQSPRTKIRSNVVSLIAFGAYNKVRKVSSKVFYLPNSSARKFKELTKMEAGCTHARVAVLDNFVYLVGSQNRQDCSGKGTVNTCFRYDPHLNQWLHIQSMQESRIQFQLTALQGQLYATGGRNSSGTLQSVECYCPKTNKWTYISSLKKQLQSHAAATLGGLLYVSGGCGTNQEDNKALHCYSPVTNHWDIKCPMNSPRLLHSMISVNDRLYALGGRIQQPVLSVEYYVPETDQWTVVSPMRTGQSEASCCLLDGKIYLVGGHNWFLDNASSVVQIYNTETDMWEKELHLPESLTCIACTSVILPHSLTQ